MQWAGIRIGLQLGTGIAIGLGLGAGLQVGTKLSHVAADIPETLHRYPAATLEHEAQSGGYIKRQWKVKAQSWG